MERAAKTWNGEWWKYGGGGAVWDAVSYDPEANLIYVGTGNGSPWPAFLRGSEHLDNLYICSILAVNPDNGQTGMALSGSAGRLLGFRQRPAIDSCGYPDRRQAAQGSHASQQGRLLLCARSDHRQVHFGDALHAGQLGERPRS